ncbi:MAG: L-threonylcarbamoyladenylate synthase [Chloroflexi bacterium]|nr:L-threonylcarbamoyladenylate synthase [Chloroflexota bacterium]
MPLVTDNLNNRSIASILLRESGVIAYPTDTLYGLGAIVFNRSAVSTVFVIKGRQRDQGLPVLVASESQLREVAADVSDEAMALAKKFWPGALTLVMKRHPDLPLNVTGGAVRLPDHPCPQSLISACGSPITGTSANKHGGLDPTSAAEVQRQLGSRLSLVLDGGPSPLGVASTVIDVTMSLPRVLRQGAISIEELRTVCPIAEPDPMPTSPEARGS